MEHFEPASGLKVFDAFPKIEKSFRAERTTRGAVLSIFLGLSLVYLFVSEFTWYFGGYEAHHFQVEKEVKEHLNINVDMTIAMTCANVAVNVQDATGDRILAGNALRKVGVDWDEGDSHHLDKEHQEAEVYDLQKVLKSARKRKFASSRDKKEGKACRIFGIMEVNHIAGDFHFTAEGVGYMSDRTTYLEDMNFTHRIDELSFGAFYPKLVNPLDGTHADAAAHFHRFQYFLNIVPTTYQSGGTVIKTNQYAVTEQSRHSDDNQAEFFPGIYVKYDIEPVSLVITDTRMPFMQFLIRLLGVLGGLVVSTDLVHKTMESIYGRIRNPARRRGTSLLDFRREEHEKSYF